MKRKFKELWIRPSEREGYVDLAFVTEDNQKIVLYNCYPIETIAIEQSKEFTKFDVNFSYNFNEDGNT